MKFLCSAGRGRNPLVLAGVLMVAWAAAASAWAQSPKTLVVLLYEQLDSSLIESTETPGFDRIRKEGAWTDSLTPAFPNTAVSNAFTISSGCWPENHGIVLDRFQDPSRGDYDRFLNADWMTGCMPMNEILNQKRRMVGVMGWPGRFRATASLASMVSQEKTPDSFVGDDARLVSVGHFLKMSHINRPSLVLAYMEGAKGAKTEDERRRALLAADATIVKLMQDIEALADGKMLALVVVSARAVQPAPLPEAVSVAIGANGVLTASEATGFVYGTDTAALSQKLSALDGVSVTPRDGQPEVWKVGTGPRVGDLIVSTDATSGSGGMFYAWGRGVQAGRKLPAMRAVDVNPTLIRGLIRVRADYPSDGRIIGELLTRPPNGVSAQASP